MKLSDKFNRTADYLRIAVTDKCNLRCRYCMPEQGIKFSNKEELLSYEEIIRLGDIFSSAGVKKVRLTGGEPFVRKEISKLIEKLANQFDHLHITSNASLLHHHYSLLDSGIISSINISLDTLNKERFFEITRRNTFDIVYKNLLYCIQSKTPTKINMVFMKGVNDMELFDFLSFGMKHSIEVRFIEAMPFNEDDGNKNSFASSNEILNLATNHFKNIEKQSTVSKSSSEQYKINGEYIFSIIPAYSRSLCGTCNRIRVTPKGEMLTCLYAQNGISLRDLVRNPILNDDDILNAIAEAILNKKKDGFEEEKLRGEEVFNSMTTIGG